MTTRFPLFTCVSEAELPDLRSLLDRERFTLLEIDGTKVCDARSFLSEARETLPLDPPQTDAVNWDSFVDSLWEGLDTLGKPRVALLWTSAHRMLEGGLPDLLLAVDALSDVARSVRDPSSGITAPIEAILFLVGTGPNFRPLKEVVAAY